jgi:hypothetical protein
VDLLNPLLSFAAAAVVGLVVGVARMLLAGRRRRRLRDGGTATCRASLGLGLGPLRSGRLLFSGEYVTWRDRRSDVRIELSGARLVSARTDPGHGQGDGVELRLVLPWQATARLALQQEDAATLVSLLGKVDAPAAPVVPDLEPGRWRRSRWATATVALAAAWFLAWAYLVLGGQTVTASVTGGDGEFLCDVTWTVHGQAHTAEVDCDNEPPGTARAVWVMAPPFSGDAVDPEMTAVMVPLLGGLGAAPGTWRLLRDRRRRLGSAKARVPVLRLPAQDLPELSDDDLVPAWNEQPGALLARLAPHALRQLPEHGWENPRRPDGARSTLSPRQVGVRLLMPLAVLVLVLGITSPWPYRWYLLNTATTGTTTGTVTHDAPIEGPGPLPDDVLVRYRTPEGTVHLAGVATGRLPGSGETVTIEYVVGDPGWARLVGSDDTLGQGAAAGLLGTLLAAAWAGLRCRGLIAWVRAMHRIYAQPTRPALGLLTADPRAVRSCWPATP